MAADRASLLAAIARRDEQLAEIVRCVNAVFEVVAHPDLEDMWLRIRLIARGPAIWCMDCQRHYGTAEVTGSTGLCDECCARRCKDTSDAA